MRPPTRSPVTPWYLRTKFFLMLEGLLALLMLGLLILGIVGVSRAIGELTGCGSGKRAVLEEFPHYGDQQYSPFSAEGACYARYATDATGVEVLGYYEKRLRENGWEYVVFREGGPVTKMGEMEPAQRLVNLAEEALRERPGLLACRGGYIYTVEYFPPGEFGAGAKFSPEGYPDVSGDDKKAAAKVDEAVVNVRVTKEPPAPEGGVC